jgi:Sec-independent protein translocase protein TatA
VPEAQAIFGVRRRTAVVAYSAGAASGEAKAAASSQQAAAAQQQAAAAQQQAAAAQQQATAAPPPPAAAAGQPLPVGTVVSALPKGCVSTPVGGVEYYYCAGNFYRAVFQGNQLVYVTAQPK